VSAHEELVLHVLHHCETLQHTAIHRNTLQGESDACVSSHRYKFAGVAPQQHTAAHCNERGTSVSVAIGFKFAGVAPLQHNIVHTATYCNTLQYTVAHCIARQYPAAHYNTLQHPTIQYNTCRVRKHVQYQVWATTTYTATHTAKKLKATPCNRYQA